MIYFAIVLALSFISAVFYRMGGSNTYNTKWRDIGCSLCATLCLILTQKLVFNVATLVALVASAGLTFAALTTYFHRKGSEVRFFNWVLVGCAWGAALLPLAFVYHAWWGLALRTVVLGLSVCAWSQASSNAVREELGRGFLLTASIPLMLI